MHVDPVANLVLALALVLTIAKIAGHVAARVGQPPVLGELLGGMLIGNMTLVGIRLFEPLEADASLEMLARLGVILLLFQVGLESTVRHMINVGPTALVVATLGVVGPFALGWGVGAWLLPDDSLYAHLFLGATLTATSVGITARVLKDLGKSQTDEARIILGAAVIDDVQGLVILAVVTGVIAAANQGVAMSYGAIGAVVAKAILFLVSALVLGVYFSQRLFQLASRLQAGGVLLATGLAFCFVLAWSAGAIGLAPIVGAFAAGLVLEDVHYRDFVDRGEHTLDELIEPIASFLVPIFFVLMGIRTDLEAFARPGVLGLAVALTAAAIIGKQACSLGVLGNQYDRLSVGIGMIPRGEVGLIFANIGLTLVVAGTPVVSQDVFAAVVVMVILTTAITPPALKWSLSRDRQTPAARRRAIN
ncbi:MAG TPA: cation:proton antiporter [Vicinamibacterales bacterium]|nr:cation:proton antiporter [Vicinamibacterales bacterium]